MRVLLLLTCLSSGLAAQVEFAAQTPTATDGGILGSVELTQVEADQAAVERAEDLVRDSMRRRGERQLEQKSPSWVPGFVQAQIQESWLAGLDLDRLFDVVDRQVQYRDEGYAVPSYQTSLAIEIDERRVNKELDRLQGQSRKAGRLFAIKCGGTVLLWGVLGLLYGLLDRMTRGYMTNRLRLLFGSLGTAIPTIAFLFA